MANFRQDFSEDLIDQISNDQSVQEPENVKKKLKKNRESAKNSRNRKKIYIELLEKKVATHNILTSICLSLSLPPPPPLAISSVNVATDPSLC